MLPLFGAASAATSGSGLPAAADGGSASSLSKAEAQDVVLNAGGPVWGLDWCPAGTAAAAEREGGGAAAAAAGPTRFDYLAVACHPLQSQHNVIGTAVHGTACIQVWELSHPQKATQQQQQSQQGQQQHEGQQQQQPPDFQLPRMALALTHDGGLAWHCQWCPDAGLEDSPAPAAHGGDEDLFPRQACSSEGQLLPAVLRSLTLLCPGAG